MNARACSRECNKATFSDQEIPIYPVLIYVFSYFPHVDRNDTDPCISIGNNIRCRGGIRNKRFIIEIGFIDHFAVPTICRYC